VAAAWAPPIGFDYTLTYEALEGNVTQFHIHIGPTGQGVSASEFSEVLNALRRGLAYANVHSTMSPGGEIRGQLKLDGDSDDR
jgi:CHRD domain-containing protein